MSHPLAPPRFCTRCGINAAIAHRTLCAPCRAKALANQDKQARLHTDSKRRLSEAQRHAKHLRDKERSNPENFKASSKAIKRQIEWMRENDLLPDSRRVDYNETTND
jgi:hypothetical protein